MDSYNSATTKPIFRASQIVWYALTLLESILLLRFFLKLLEANPLAIFSHFIYSVSGPFVSPFRAVFRSTYVEGNIFEWTTLLAVLVYWLIAMAVVNLLFMSRTVSTPEAAELIAHEEV